MTKTRLWLVLTAVGVVAVLAGGWFLLVSPKRAEANDLRAETAATEQQVSVLRSRLAELREKQANLPAQQAALEAISKQIPSDPAQPAMIRALTNAARTSGIKLISIAPGQPGPLAPVPATGGSAANATQINSIQLTLSAKGTYTQVQQFIQRLESLQRAFLVQGFQVSAGGDTAAGSGSTSSDLALSVAGQVFTSVATAATPATTGGSAATGATNGTVAN
jgi:type IV pilus assembly protein PilO